MTARWLEDVEMAFVGWEERGRSRYTDPERTRDSRKKTDEEQEGL